MLARSIMRGVLKNTTVTRNWRQVLCAASLHNPTTQLEGVWYNELNSHMNLEVADDGSITGTYYTKVGDAKIEYPLSGRYDTGDKGRTLGWTVAWNGVGSTTTWSGQYLVDSCTNKAEILTTWLLTVQTSEEKEWESTNVGQDNFSRDPPQQEACERAQKRGHTSHPKAIMKPQAELTNRE